MRSRLNSRLRRSWMISRCSRPRNPQRKPKPRAAEVSISKEKLASFSRSLPMAARSSSKAEASTGKRPQKTTGWAGRKSGKGLGGGGGAPERVGAEGGRGGEEGDSTC